MPVSSGLWDAIEQNLDRKDKRPKVWFLLMSLLIGLPLLFFAYYYPISVDSKEKPSLENTDDKYFAENSVLSDRFENFVDTENLVSDNSMKLNQTLSIEKIPSLSYNSIGSFKNSPQNLSFQIASGNKQRKLTPFTQIGLAGLNKEIIFQLNQEEDILLFPRLFNSGNDCPDFKRKWPGLYLYSQLGSYYPFQSLSSDGSEMSSLISERDLTESGVPSFSFETGLGYDFYNGLFVQTGISYNQINIKFYHRQEDIINNITSIIIDTLFNPQGEVVSINKDTSVYQEIGVQELTVNNSFKMLDIPISVGYSYPLTDKIHLRASAGLIFNMRTRSRGYMVDSNGEPYEYGRNDNDLFKTKWGLSYSGALDLETIINDKFSFNAGLNMRYFSKNINVSTNAVDQRFFNLGIVAGVKYRI